MADQSFKTQQSVSKKYRKRSQIAEVWHRISKNKGAMVGLAFITLLILIALSADLWIDFDTQIIGLNVSQRLKPPSAKNWMGTDEVGRDIFFRLIYGTRYSLPIGLVAVLIALFIGCTLGAIAGFYGGLTENIIMRMSDIFGSVPNMLMAICLVSALGRNIFNLMLAVGLTSVPNFVRITRASVLTVRSQDYVEASLALGVSKNKVIFTHILPNCLSPIIVQTTIRIASAVISASSLSFLGLGIQPPYPEWGAMLSSGREYIRGYSYMTLFPGIMIMMTVLSFNIVGDALRDALDPKLKGR